LSEVLDIQTVVSVLVKELTLLKQALEKVTKENTELRERLLRYEHPKDSHNSNLPSTKNPIGMKKKVNLREKSERKSGGQVGHPGKCLEMQTPDSTELLVPHYCSSCGRDLSDIEGEEGERRQQIDIPPIHPIVTEYRQIRKVCSCSQVNIVEFPSTVTAQVCYGSNLQALVTYMSVCQQIPYKRMTQMLNEIFGVSVSEGTVKNILDRIEKRLTPAYETIRQRIFESAVAGADETGISVNGKRSWAWALQTRLLTYITAGHSRKKEVFDGIMPGGMPNTILVSDCYSSYFSANVKNHQICTSHILRELIYLSELHKDNPWSEEMANLIREAIHLKKVTNGNIDDTSIQQRLQLLLDQSIDQTHKKIQTLQKRLIRYRDYLFLFLKNEYVPPDNNASERSIRVFKVKLKVSGFFKSKVGAQRFALLHSIADTARKNNNSPFRIFQLAALCKANESGQKSILR
jgi:transposase